MIGECLSLPLTIHTPRLLLRQWRDEDYPAFAALNADPEVMAWFPSPLTSTGSDALADRLRSFIRERGWGLWALQTRQEGRFIGFTGLAIPHPELPCSPCVEVGWRLSRDAWGKGYATEAGRAAVEYGFQALGLEEVVAFTAVGNTRSRAVMERLGMRPDPETFLHPLLPEHSLLREHCLYRIARFSPA